MNKKIMGLAYGAAVSSNLEIFSTGKRMRGSNATTGMGKASVSHQVIISAAMANTIAALGDAANGFTKNSKSEITIPASSEINFNCCFFKLLDLPSKYNLF